MERVGIYNRCSTEEESQKNALAAQAMESREIALKKGWSIVEQYIESETGTVAYKRGEYQRLLDDMEKDKFDIVMIKSIDRLTRCAKDWYFFLNRLTENGLRLYLYIEGKYYTPDDNLISGIKAILAEDFSRELSKKIKNAHRRRQEKISGYNITCEMFGWDKKAKDTYEINEQEAEYYRTAFLLAMEGKGFYSISNILYELGARGKKGNKISEVQWRKMLYTPRAHGTIVLNKRSYNFDRKKYEDVPEKDWIIVENALPPIVSKEYQEEVIRTLQQRAAESPCKVRAALKQEIQDKSVGRACVKGKYQLSRRLVCAECGKYYYRTLQRSGAGDKVVWKCSTFLSEGRPSGERFSERELSERKFSGGKGGKREGRTGCGNINLYEDAVLKCVLEACVKQSGFSQEDFEDLERETIRILKRLFHPKKIQTELAGWEKEYRRLKVKKDVLVEKLLDKVIDDRDFKRYHEEISGQMKSLEEKINSIKDDNAQYNSYEMRIQKIKEELKKSGLMQKAIAVELLAQTDYIEARRDGRLLIWMPKDNIDFLPGNLKENLAGKCMGKEGEKKEFYCIQAQYIREHR